MPLYEHTFLSRQNLTSQQALGLADRFTAVITEGGGRLVDQEYWGLRSLAYRIRNNRKAHYCFMRTDAPAAAVHEMERRMRINEDVLRVLTVQVDKHDQGATPILKAKSSRDNRRPRRRSSDEMGDGGERMDSKPARPAAADRPTDAPAEAIAGTIDSMPDAASEPAVPLDSPDTPPSDFVPEHGLEMDAPTGEGMDMQGNFETSPAPTSESTESDVAATGAAEVSPAVESGVDTPPVASDESLASSETEEENR